MLALVVDLDCLRNSSNREHLRLSKFTNAYNSAASNDSKILPVVDLVRAMSRAGYAIVILHKSPNEPVEQWLYTHKIPYMDLLNIDNVHTLDVRWNYLKADRAYSIAFTITNDAEKIEFYSTRKVPCLQFLKDKLYPSLIELRRIHEQSDK